MLLATWAFLVNDITADTFLVNASEMSLEEFLLEWFSFFLIKADTGFLTLLKGEGIFGIVYLCVKGQLVLSLETIL